MKHQRRYRLLYSVVCAAALIASRGAGAQTVAPTPTADSVRLRAALQASVKRLVALDKQVAGAMMTGQMDTAKARRLRPIASERQLARMKTEALLDTVVFGAEWGPRELAVLRREYPESPTVLHVSAKLAEREDRLDEALVMYARLLHDDPTNVDLQRASAGANLRARRFEAARLGFSRTLELAPDDSISFRELVRLHDAAGTLPDLLARVQRIAPRQLDKRVAIERQVELLHRLGRTTEADSITRASKATGRGGA
jgi:predicted Zn-dependent protease